MDFEDYLRQVRDRLLGSPAEKEAVLSELRSHLWEKLDDLKSGDPRADEEVLMRRVLQDFGSPADVAAAYHPAGRILVAERESGVVYTIERGLSRAGSTLSATGRDAARKLDAAGKRAYSWGEARAPRVARTARNVVRFVVRALAWLFLVLARFLRATLRTLGSILRYTTVTVLVVLAFATLVATVAGLVLFDDIRAEIGAQGSEQVLRLSGTCPTECDGVDGPVRFYVNPAANRLTVYLESWVHEGNNGTARVVIEAPDGIALLDREIGPSGPTDSSERYRWEPHPGDWSIWYETNGFRGTLRTDAFVQGVPV